MNLPQPTIIEFKKSTNNNRYVTFYIACQEKAKFIKEHYKKFQVENMLSEYVDERLDKCNKYHPVELNLLIAPNFNVDEVIEFLTSNSNTEKNNEL